jgi:endonuclease/exonuclease/phosphatase family metal-dependent hydrolase
MALSIATFNVKNLLEPTTGAALAIQSRKLDAIAEVLRACDADVVGLQEIGSAALLAQVLDRLEGRGGYTEAIMGTVDARGIGCALLSRVPVQSSRIHACAALPFPVFRDGDPAPFGTRIPLRRGVVHVRVRAEGTGTVDILVAHFKSGRAVPARDAAGVERRPTTARARVEGDLRSQVWRASEALFVRGCVDDVLATNASAQIAVVGDLNDVLDSWAVRAVRGGDSGDGALLDASAGIPPEARFSTLHGGRRMQIDHVLVSAPLHARILHARMLNESLREHDPLPELGPESRPQPQDETPTADSDHAALVVWFG